MLTAQLVTPAVNGDAPPVSGPIAEAKRLVATEQCLLRAIQWVVFGGVILLTVEAGALSWEHLTHIAATNGHIAPRHLLFLFPAIVDGFMVMSSGVVVRHALTDELGGRTWYAGCLVAATASLSVCLNIQDSTGRAIVPGWMLPGIAPALYMLGTELGIAELRLLMRKLRSRIRAYDLPAEPPAPPKKDVVLAVLAETSGRVPAALELLAERGVSVDRSYIYEIKRSAANLKEGDMTVEEIADYIINHDMELQIINGDGLEILDQLAFDGLPTVSDYEVGEAIELARQDPWRASYRRTAMRANRRYGIADPGESWSATRNPRWNERFLRLSIATNKVVATNTYGLLSCVEPTHLG